MIVYTDKRRVAFIIDDDDYEAVSHYRWSIAGTSRYPTTQVGSGRKNRKAVTLHVFLMGRAPDGFEWDHRDRDKLNNRRSNFRLRTRQQNARNVGPRRNNKSGIKGVHWRKDIGKWTAQINVGGKVRNLGTFAEIEAAAAARQNAEQAAGY